MSTWLIIFAEAVALGFLGLLFWLAQRWITRHADHHQETTEALHQVKTEFKLVAQQNELDHLHVREALQGVRVGLGDMSNEVNELRGEVTQVKADVAEVRGAQAAIIGDYKKLPAFQQNP